MRNALLCLAIFLGACVNVNAANLIDVYQQAVTNDAVFQQAVSQRLADNESVPISFANLLPNIGLTATPSVNKYATSGPASLGVGSYSTRAYAVNAVVTQTIFNYAQFANLAGAKASAKQADATFNAAAQSLMLRTSNAYFAVLQDEDNVLYAESNKAAYAKQLDQINQQYKVGLKTITDVYTARASFDGSEASLIAANTQLLNDKENLRVITGNVYPSMAKLSERFPLTSPQPAAIETWVNTAVKQNWNIKASQYANDVALQNMKQQFAGHLPTLSAEGIYNIQYTRNTGGQSPIGSLFQPKGAMQSHNRTVQLNLNVPVFAGGGVVAQTRQAKYAYQVTSQQLEQSVRNTVNTTRQSYLGVIAGISKIKADKETIVSLQSSLDGMEEQYRVGTATLVDVLNQQRLLYQAQQQYSADRYSYIKNLLTLKQAAGTLSPDDLAAVNAWLGNDRYDDANATPTQSKKRKSRLQHSWG